MASRRNRRTLKRQSKRVRGGVRPGAAGPPADPPAVPNSAAPPADPNSAAPPAVPNSADPPAAQATGKGILDTLSSYNPFSLFSNSKPTATPQKTSGVPGRGGKRMRKTSKRKSRR